MKPAPFDYVVPQSVEEAVALLADEDVESQVLAGGQSLVPLLNMRMARPELIVDLGKLEALDFIRETDDGGLAIGAMATKRSVEFSPLAQKNQPLLHAATKWIAHPQIRNRGTMGGSLAQADPAAEYPAVALILEGEIHAQGPDGTRTIPASEFFFTYLTTALQENELLTEIRVPAFPETRGWAFNEIARRHGDFAMAGAAVTLDLDASGHCANTHVVVFALGDTPLRATKVEEAINGEKPSQALFEIACKQVTDGVDEPLSDVHASAEYRAELARVLTQRALVEAVGRAGGSL